MATSYIDVTWYYGIQMITEHMYISRKTFINSNRKCCKYLSGDATSMKRGTVNLSI